MFNIQIIYYLFNLIEKHNDNKVVNNITFHLSFKTFYYVCMCVDGVTKIVEH
jgi:hypothetical protein